MLEFTQNLRMGFCPREDREFGPPPPVDGLDQDVGRSANDDGEGVNSEQPANNRRTNRAL